MKYSLHRCAVAMTVDQGGVSMIPSVCARDPRPGAPLRLRPRLLAMRLLETHKIHGAILARARGRPETNEPWHNDSC